MKADYAKYLKKHLIYEHHDGPQNRCAYITR